MVAQRDNIRLAPGAGEHARAGKRGLKGWLWLSGLAILAGGLAGSAVATNSASSNATPFRVAFSSRMFAGVNENDARAAVKAWAVNVARERNLAVDSTATIASADTLEDLLTRHQVDALGLPVDEFLALSKREAFSPVFVGVQGDRFTDEYLLLVHSESTVRTVADLRSKSLLSFDNPRTWLALPRLDTLLSREGLDRVEQFFGAVTRQPKLSAAVLPVFFRTTDACLVTRVGFDTLAELNPQVGKRLRVLARSPELVPTIFAIRADYDAPVRDEVLAAIRDLHQTVAGQQVLTVFQIGRLEMRPLSSLKSAAALMEEHARLRQPPAPANRTLDNTARPPL